MPPNARRYARALNPEPGNAFSVGSGQSGKSNTEPTPRPFEERRLEMSEKEKQILDKIAQLPAPLQDKFLDRLEGARLAIDAIGTPPKEGDHAKNDP